MFWFRNELVKIRIVVYNNNRGVDMDSYSIIVLIFGIISFILLILVYFVNRIIFYKTRINNSFLTIRELLDDRVDLVDEMLEFVKDNLEYEKSYYKRLLQAKEVLVTIKNNKEGISDYKRTVEVIASFSKLDNTYKKLAKNKDYLKIVENISRNNDKLIYAMDSYDKGVIDYNNYRVNKLIFFLSKICGIPEYGCYNK